MRPFLTKNVRWKIGASSELDRSPCPDYDKAEGKNNRGGKWRIRTTLSTTPTKRRLWSLIAKGFRITRGGGGAIDTVREGNQADEKNENCQTLPNFPLPVGVFLEKRTVESRRKVVRAVGKYSFQTMWSQLKRTYLVCLGLWGGERVVVGCEALMEGNPERHYGGK